MSWKLTADPVEHSADKNDGGIVISLLDLKTSSKTEIGRVGFERSASLNPYVSYEDQLDIEVAKARKSIELLNELTAGAGSLT